MSLTPDTRGTAHIEVQSAGASPRITVTRKVKAFAGGVLGLVIWRVRNATGVEGSVNVEVKNFNTVALSGLAYAAVQSFDEPVVFLGSSSVHVDEGRTKGIVASVQGASGDLLSYEVWVDGTKVTDPHIEI